MARRYAVSANLIFKWLRDARYAPDPAAVPSSSEGARFLPVEVVAEEQPPAIGPVGENRIEIEEAVLKQDPFAGHLFVFRGCRDDLVKVIWWDGLGACMFMKRLERGRFVWLSATEGKVALTLAQLSMLLEGIDWRAPQRTWRPLAAG